MKSPESSKHAATIPAHRPTILHSQDGEGVRLEVSAYSKSSAAPALAPTRQRRRIHRRGAANLSPLRALRYPASRSDTRGIGAQSMHANG